VIELLGRFPIREIVTTLAVIPELAFVRVLVTSDAILRQAEKRLGQILHFDERALVRNHVRGHVTFLTGNAYVLPFQVVPGQPVIKLFLGWLPVNQRKLLAVVIEVAADAVLAIRIWHLQAGMITVIGGDALSDFLVAVEALEGRHAGAELMATGALRSTSQRLMRFRERAGRDLRLCSSCGEERNKREKENTSKPS